MFLTDHDRVFSVDVHSERCDSDALSGHVTAGLYAVAAIVRQ